MGKIMKKGKSGEAAMYVSRNKALKKLQITLADFRRLCILKGIFPREPNNIKKLQNGSSALTTYYLTKDIQFLAHEPVLKKFREHKTFMKKLNKALAKGEKDTAKRMEARRPKYTLDHIIKERYPTFVDAIRDLEDPLCMIYLFAAMPKVHNMPVEMLARAKRLCREFEMYLMHTRSLRKCFLSIKGIYYQGEIEGETVTWLVPYDFCQNVPTDVDFRVMSTFLEFSLETLGFVLFKLFADLGIKYPLALDEKMDAALAGFKSYTLEKVGDLVPGLVKKDESSVQVDEKVLEEKKKSLQSKLASIVAEDEQEVAKTEVVESSTAAATEMDDFSQLNADNSVTLSDLEKNATNLDSFKNLFSGLYFFISREVSRSAVEFISRAFGAEVGWELGEGSPFSIDDSRVTHIITDRPVVAASAVVGKSWVKVQPQWIFDCVNKSALISTANYAPGAQLPPHLSPFVNNETLLYNPEEPMPEVEEQAEQEETESNEKKEESPSTAAVEGDYQRELEEEIAENTASTVPKKKNKKTKKPATITSMGDAENDEAERKQMAINMMSKKTKKLYDRMMHGKRKQEAEAENLREKRKKIISEKKKSGSKNTSTA